MPRALKKIAYKLRSVRGASVTFALLLFLVCAVIGSVVLTAGSASAGTFSELTEMDSRYYSVTSAAGLLRDSLDGARATVTVSTVTDITTTTVFTDGVGASPTVTRGVPSKSAPTVESSQAIIADAAERLAGSMTDSFTRTLSLQHNPVSGIDADALDVTVLQTLGTDGTLSFKLTNASGEPYSLILTFELQRTYSGSVNTVEGDQTVRVTAENSYTVTRVDTETAVDTSVYVWTLTGVRKADA